MKKLFAKIGLTVGLLLAGCTTLNNLTPAQVAAIGTVVTQVADQGAVYAIQQDKNNAVYFKTAIPVLNNFANGTDLSPTALQAALAKVTGTNQWVNLAITAVVTTYDITYGQYISNQLTNAPYAKVWITDVGVGFQQALDQTGTAAFKKGVLVAKTAPDFYKDGKVDKAVLKARVKAAAKR